MLPNMALVTMDDGSQHQLSEREMFEVGMKLRKWDNDYSKVLTVVKVEPLYWREDD
jgi:hypothetical protein